MECTGTGTVIAEAACAGSAESVQGCIIWIQAAQHQWSDVPVQLVDGMERAISISATLCLRALRHGMSAGFATNASLIGSRGSGKGTLVCSMGGNAQADKLLETMARIEMHMEMSFPTFLGTLEDVRTEDILIVTAYEDDDIMAAVSRLKLQGNTVSMYVL